MDIDKVWGLAVGEKGGLGGGGAKREKRNWEKCNRVNNNKKLQNLESYSMAVAWS